MQLANLVWLFRRFARMSSAERFHRVHEIQTKRQLHKSPEAPQADTESIARLNFTHILERAQAQECQLQWQQAQTSVLAYSKPWPVDSDGNLLWQSFLNGEDTSSQWCFDVSYRDTGNLIDDVRFAWEVNRLTFLIPIACHALLAQDKSAEEFVVKTVSHFLETDHIGYGLRWNSMIELSMQSLSLVILDSLMQNSPGWQNITKHMGFALRQRYYWIESLPSLYSSANNHRLAELAALTVLAKVLPEKNLDLAGHLNAFESEVAKQFGEDGFNAELSFDYHTYSMDLLLTVILALGDQAPVALREHFKHIGNTTANLYDFVELWPSAADSDQACLLSTVVTDKARPKWLADFADIDLARLDTKSLNTFVLPKAGYSFVKHSSDNGTSVVMADHGALGYGNISAHAHADTLGIWMWINQQPWLVEAGTYSYHSSAQMRDELRYSGMHNCISVNGVSTSIADGPFLWNPKRSTCDTYGQLQRFDEWVDIVMTTKIPSIPRVRPKSTHSRTVRCMGLAVNLRDTVEARKPIEIASHLIAAPGFRVAVESPGMLVLEKTDVGTLTITYDPDVATLCTDSVSVSPSYGVLETATRLVVTTNNMACNQMIDLRMVAEPTNS